MDEVQKQTIEKLLFWLKQWFKSKTFWFNFINLLILSLEVVFENYPVDPKLHATILSLGNLYLRYLTNKPISAK